MKIEIAHEEFTILFNAGLELLGSDDKEAAALFDTSIPNIKRWRCGSVVPPAASLVLKFLCTALKIRTLNSL